jgi:sulfotransferase
MNKIYEQFVCLSGLPRSGSTLLSAILCQNPKIHAEGNSALCQLMWDMDQSLLHHCNEQIIANNRNHTIYDLISNIPNIYYKDIDVNEKIIVDKCRTWTLHDNVELLKKYIDDNIKIIVLERPIVEIVNSIVKLYRKNNRSIDIEKLLEIGTEPIMRPFAGIINAKNNNIHNNFLFISYKELTENPEETMKKIYNFCNWEYFHHDFNNIIPKYKENDEIYGLNGFHDVFKKILVNGCDIDLPENIIEKCLLMEEGVNK